MSGYDDSILRRWVCLLWRAGVPFAFGRNNVLDEEFCGCCSFVEPIEKADKKAAAFRKTAAFVMLWFFERADYYTQPCACMAFATFSKPARFAPARKLPLTP